MKLFNSYKDRNDFLKLFLKIVVALALIQLFRAAIFGSLWWVVNPGDNITLFQMINGLDYLVVGIVLLLYFRPSLKDIGLNQDDMILRTRIFYGLALLVLITLIIIPYTFGWELQILIMGLVFGLITPLFEELLFRGYIWGKIPIPWNGLSSCHDTHHGNFTFHGMALGISGCFNPSSTGLH